MPNFTIPDLKRALVEVKRICKEQNGCDECPMRIDHGRTTTCRLCDIHIQATVPPMDWYVDDWKEDYDDAEAIDCKKGT